MEEEKKRSGCGLLVLYNGVFRRRTPPCPPRSASASSIPQSESAAIAKLTTSNSRRRRGGSDEATLLVPAKLAEPPITHSQLNSKTLVPHHHKAAKKQPDSIKAMPGARVQSNGISTELDCVIHDHQRAKGSSTLVRASSSNVMVFGNLGNLRATVNSAASPNRNVLDYLPKTAKEKNRPHGTNCVTGNVVKNILKEPAAPVVLCRALSKRLDPEELKEMGNEEYKKGRFAEAVALYDRAIMIDQDKASYWSNKAAALMGLGQLLEAVGECREAVRIDPTYCRAHHRLATLYLRLGEAEKAVHHYKLSRTEANTNDILRAQSLQTHLAKYNEARMLRDWHTVLKETQLAISAGADSAPQVFASQAEAFLKLHKHDEADVALTSTPKFDIDASTKFFGAAGNAYLLAVQAQVDMAAGRFEDAVAVAQRASQLDPSSREISAVIQKTRAVALGRSKGNDLFKASKFGEACVAYGEGLDHDSHNAILLCNRAACRSKLGQWEKAIEDCNTALSVRPSYTKALMRRANCNAKLEHWEASIQDYEALIRDMPGDEEVGKALFEAQVQLKKKRGEDIKDTKFCSDLVLITTSEQFRRIIMSPGLTVVLFFKKSSEISKRIVPPMEKLCMQYPSVKFLKVDTEDNPSLAKSEGVSSTPSFKIYKNGSKVQDIAGSDHDQLERSLKVFGT